MDTINNFIENLINVYWKHFFHDVLFFIIICISCFTSYYLFSEVLKLDLNVFDNTTPNIPKCIVFLLLTIFIIFILSLILNYIYIRINKNEWFYNLTNAFLLLMTGVVIFFIIGLNPIMENYLIARFKMTIDLTKYTPEKLLESIEIIKATYNMFMYWMALFKNFLYINE